MESLGRLRHLIVFLVCPTILMITCISGRSRVWDSETIGHQSPVPRWQNHPQYKQPNLLSGVVRKLFPRLHENLWHTVTEPRTATLLPGDHGIAPQSSHHSTTVVPYLTFPTIVGKNSAFQNLTQEQLEELGGIEFRALNMLMWAVPLVRCFCSSSDTSLLPYFSIISFRC